MSHPKVQKNRAVPMWPWGVTCRLLPAPGLFRRSRLDAPPRSDLSVHAGRSNARAVQLAPSATRSVAARLFPTTHRSSNAARVRALLLLELGASSERGGQTSCYSVWPGRSLPEWRSGAGRESDAPLWIVKSQTRWSTRVHSCVPVNWYLFPLFDSAGHKSVVFIAPRPPA